MTHPTLTAPSKTTPDWLTRLAEDAQAALAETITDHEHQGITLTGHDIAEVPYATLHALVALAHAAAALPHLADATHDGRGRGLELATAALSDAVPAATGSVGGGGW